MAASMPVTIHLYGVVEGSPEIHHIGEVDVDGFQPESALMAAFKAGLDALRQNLGSTDD